MTTETQSHRDAPGKELTAAVIGAAIEVHRALGAGLLERIYEECLCLELRLRNLRFRRQAPLPLQYKGHRLGASYSMDHIVEQELVVELKAVEQLLPVHRAQLLTYLRVSGLRLGLILNFNVPVLTQGIVRMSL